ncbi:hypothetical protein HETIRDRAFT_330370 [Heterobasidion irregulare TC 32-1]|uniref:Uncharacterized protein n=1 Tax=Heterobasidion irregulare (strain TC 32-1) TaxID=747525 RepID=W4JRC9_HETIT|nr:uncharacterized protein HETIRDRAFT_330370 [Heterobasidion irregulare TC 32-1]ETW76019.1 hypothetical protein HETIRDRAFT_330370 [Heterobasidion irregulare TC 32-1]
MALASGDFQKSRYTVHLQGPGHPSFLKGGTVARLETAIQTIDLHNKKVFKPLVARLLLELDVSQYRCPNFLDLAV